MKLKLTRFLKPGKCV